jgi:hypothetical protein
LINWLVYFALQAKSFFPPPFDTPLTTYFS